MPDTASRGAFVDIDAALPLSPPDGFSTRCIDDDPAALAQSYRLRHRVYCIERGFLRAADYPDGFEKDEFDQYSRHLGTFDSTGQMVGTARLVFPSMVGLPLFRRCSVFPDERELHDPGNVVVEASRLAVTRQHRIRERRREVREEAAGLTGTRRRSDAVVFSLYRGLYQESKRARVTHWIAATEASYQRHATAYGYQFRAIGPETDYFGPVAPYLMNIIDWDRAVLSGAFPRLEGFLDGLEDAYRPRDGELQPCLVPCGTGRNSALR